MARPWPLWRHLSELSSPAPAPGLVMYARVRSGCLGMVFLREEQCPDCDSTKRAPGYLDV
ncbi:hypothetical protein ACVWZT_003802 [Pseudomonas sp. TE21394]